MVSAKMAPSTPSPSSSVRTPPAPRLGFHDDWEPFTPRKSSRLSAQRNAARTPSPQPTVRQPLASPRTTKKSIGQTNAAMTSPVSSPQKKRQPATTDSVRRVPSDAASSAASSASGSKDTKPVQKPAASHVSRSAAMLPTPSKTPQKPPCAKSSANIKTFARNLFPADDSAASLLSPRKKRASKYSNMTLDSFIVEEEEEPIQIFTDSQDRVPGKEENESNPFFNAAQHDSPRRSKRRQIMIPGEGLQSIEEASRRKDGMIYVFRGKKFFRKFAESQDEEHNDSETEIEAHLGRALTRSAIKPKLLFPVKKMEKTKEMLEEEEDATDVEEANKVPTKEAEAEADPHTPVESSKPERAETPEAPKFAPVSPPDTKRITRSTNKLVDAPTPIKRVNKKSPFDSWRRTKESAATPTATKRQGEPLTSAAVKRNRV